MKTRPCPVTPDVCSPVTGWEPFCAHVYETHTDPSLSERERTTEVDKILHLSPAERQARQAELAKRQTMHVVHPPAQVVPKVTAFDETAALWAVMNEDPAAAQSLITSMLPGERAEFEAHLSVLMSLVWSAA